jgi:phenylalanyl-tRNA synthetase alpha chain
MPPEHPARDMQDTFYLDQNQQKLLRTHTTSVTLGRELPKRRPPFAVLATGSCFRRDEDTTHTPMFHQFDGIVVGEGITFADLRGTLETAMRRIFEHDLSVRFRISYFPFVEPGAEFDVAFTKAAGKQRSWLEIGGCGMIHPNVLKMAGHDPEKVSGLAFGFGVERPFMIKHGVPDLRLFFANDLRFIEQF